jgi:hypothetical protein
MVNAAEKAGLKVRLNDMGDNPKVKTDADIVTLDNSLPTVFAVARYARAYMNELTGSELPEVPTPPKRTGPAGGPPPGRSAHPH